MKTAKELFRASPQYKDYQALLTNPAFEPACHAALGALVESFPPVADVSRAWDAYLQILGARALIQQLSRLHEPDTEPKQPQWPELNYSKPKG